MIKGLFIFLFSIWSILCCQVAFAQSAAQSCPLNINFSTGDLTHWEAYTTKFVPGTTIRDTMPPLRYDSSKNQPLGTIAARSIPEYGLPSIPGIHTITTQGVDPFGGFPTIPTINGYTYNYSILLGSTSISRNTAGGGSSNASGYVRGVSYLINVPVSATTQPYTMTYAYAMVLENGAHNSDQQPLFLAKLTTSSGVVTCASPSYYLPTFNNTPNGGNTATLDSAAAIANGFKVSGKPSPNADPNARNGTNVHLQDVWTKGWTEVTFDLSPYRGQQVTLTFEADNCVPGGHFAYAYVALRNQCAGLMISGDSAACTNTSGVYSIPSLTGATYQWSVPSDWVITSGANSNIITVTPGVQNGMIIAHEINGCANLRDTLDVKSLPPTIPGNLSGNAAVCAGSNSSIITLSGNTGTVINWIASIDSGNTWTNVTDTTASYNAQNLTATTIFKAVVQNGQACSIDTSSVAVVSVDQKSIGGNLLPADTAICKNQNVAIVLALENHNGAIQNWQLSTDSINWSGFSPTYIDTVYGISGLSTTTYYRSLVKNGVCPVDTSSVSSVKYYNTSFPQATAEPADTLICYGGTAQLHAVINIGTSYSWTSSDSLLSLSNGQVSSTPYPLSDKVNPLQSSYYALTILNAGCPNALIDTFTVNVVPKIIVDAGNDTAIVINEPLQLNGTSNDNTESLYAWTPPTGLNFTTISDPIATLSDNISYVLKVTDAFGCYGLDTINVKVFKTLPDIFLPNAFTPGKNINNIFRPIAVGVTSLEFFRVFNRWGQLVYSTSQLGQGWDGTYGGKPQDTDSFVWMVQGTSYLGNKIFKKGTMTLIR